MIITDKIQQQQQQNQIETGLRKRNEEENEENRNGICCAICKMKSLQFFRFIENAKIQ